MPNRTLVASLAALLLTIPGVASAQTSAKSLVRPRIGAAIDESARVTLPGSRPGTALAANDIGEVPGNTPIAGITLVFSRSAAQQTALDTLIAAQQDPSSPQYHQWLTPSQFGAQFGMADSDLSTTEAWLQRSGFTVTGVSPSRDRITASGTAAQVATAFGTPLHYYREAASQSAADSTAHYAPATDISLPATLASTVLSVNNLSSFRLKPHVRLQTAFTSAQTGGHFVQPGDITTIYDVNAAYNSGYTGSGVSIAIVGQTAVSLSDITNFQTAAGVPVRSPSQVLVPGSGVATTYTGDLAESDLDLEYSSAIAKGASIYFVYTGNNSNYGVLDSLNYAVQQNIAPIISTSYGACEAAIGSSKIAQTEAIAQQAAAQGQTIIASSGDDGSTDCSTESGVGLSTAQQYGLAVDYPAASAYVTGLGGTEFPTADTASTNSTYFTAASGTDVLVSAKGYVPEQVWNDSTNASTSLSSGGGGTSIYINRPSWQAGTIGGVAIPSGSYRLVPDISLDSSNASAPYLFCTSDTTAYSSGQSGSCANGFRDNNNTDLTVAGGTSFAAPIFAGMVALIVQAKGGAGLGLLNPTLYTLAANATTYASAFHDITAGSNACLGASSVCSGTGTSTNFVATTGYDEATGLGSVDLEAFLTAFLASSPSTKSASKVTLTPGTLTPASGASDSITITVASNGTGTATPTGTVAIKVDGATAAGSPFSLSGGSITYTFSSTSSGSHVVTAVYSGDATYSSSSASLTLTSGGSFTLSSSPSTISVTAGSSGTSTITVSPTQGYTGTVAFVATASASLTNACYAINNVAVTSAAAASTTLTLYTSASSCSGTIANGVQAYRLGGTGGHANLLWTAPPSSSPAPSRAPALAAFGGGVLLLTLLRRRKLGARLAAATLSLGLLLTLGLGLTGCSDQTTVATPGTGTNAPVGTYTITLAGSDAVNGTLSSATTLTLSVH